MTSGLAWILLISYLFDVILLQNEFRKFVFLGDVLQIVQIEWKRILPVVVLMVVLTGTFSPSNARTESDTFPLYPCIHPIKASSMTNARWTVFTALSSWWILIVPAAEKLTKNASKKPKRNIKQF